MGSNTHIKSIHIATFFERNCSGENCNMISEQIYQGFDVFTFPGFILSQSPENVMSVN